MIDIRPGFERRSISKMERNEGLTERNKPTPKQQPPQPTMTADDVAKLSEKLSGVQASSDEVSKKIEAARNKLRGIKVVQED